MSQSNQQWLSGAASAAAAPTIAGTQLTVAELMDQIGQTKTGLATQQAQTGLQGAYMEANAGIGQEQIGLQQQGLASQAGLLNTQFGLAQQGRQASEQLTGQQFGLQQAANQQAKTPANTSQLTRARHAPTRPPWSGVQHKQYRPQ